jgi:hypothetical protein
MDIRTTAAAGVCAVGVIGGLLGTPAPSARADYSDPAPPAPPTPAEVPHLSSPENLPPGTTEDPTGPPQSRGLTYLQELWHAVQTQDVSLGDAMLLLAQSPMDPDPVPPPGMPLNPQPPPSAPSSR